MIGTNKTPLEAFKAYIAVKQHFNTKKFNIFDSGICIRATQDQLNERNDRGFFEKLSREYLAGDLLNYYASNIMAGRTHPSEMQDVIYREFMSKLFSIEYMFEQDLIFLVNLGYGFKNIFRTKNGKLPIALQAMHGKHINIETICIINKITNGAIMDVFKSEITDPLLWKDIQLKLEKYEGWVQIKDINKLKIILNKYIEE